MGRLAAARRRGLCRRRDPADRSGALGRGQLQDVRSKRRPAARLRHQCLRRHCELHGRRHPHHPAARLGRALLRHRQRQPVAVLHHCGWLHGQSLPLGRERELHQLAGRRWRQLPARLRGRRQCRLDRRNGTGSDLGRRYRREHRRRGPPACVGGVVERLRLRSDAERSLAKHHVRGGRWRSQLERRRAGVASGRRIGSVWPEQPHLRERAHLVADARQRRTTDLHRSALVDCARIGFHHWGETGQHAEGRYPFGATRRQHHVRWRLNHRRHAQRPCGKYQPHRVHVWR